MLHTALTASATVDCPNTVVQTTSAGKLVITAHTITNVALMKYAVMATAFIRASGLAEASQALWSEQSFLSPSLLPSRHVVAVLVARTTTTERPELL